ncbi:recombinase family protein [Desertibaculum subflavum]|uniref:recombinase family protein n=1 Tax=Desertibaculum subflavum TaxID=2268458 RepID=UPI000E6702EE
MVGSDAIRPGRSGRGPRRPKPKQYVAYYRVSTVPQQRSGLGLAAQHASVRAFLGQYGGELIAEFEEQDAAHRKPEDRPALRAALELCRRKTATLLVARLDRLARSVLIVANLIKEGVDFVAADVPQANRFTIHILAAVAEYERRITGARIREALAAYKNAGGKIGFARMSKKRQREAAARGLAINQERLNRFAKALLPIIDELRVSGCTTCAAIARALNRRKIPTFYNRGPWYDGTVAGMIRRADPSSPLVRPGRLQEYAAMRARANHIRSAQIAVNFAKSLVPLVDQLRADGITTWVDLAHALDERRIPTRRDRPHWSSWGLKQIIERGEKALGRHRSTDTQPARPALRRLLPGQHQAAG